MEHTVNCAIGETLESKHPRWRGRIWVEQTRVIKKKPQLRPDIIVRHPGGLPVVIENEFSPARTVEAEALSRLGLSLKSGDPIEQVIALKTPRSFIKSTDLKESIRTEENFELCVFSSRDDGSERWPKDGWIKVNIDGLAEAVELVALSENLLEQGMEILENAVGETATMLMEAGEKRQGMLEHIANELYQEEHEQTWKMAMAIITNALAFHKTIEGSDQIETIERLKDDDGSITPSKISDAWRHIYNNINYQPIFKTAEALLSHIPDAAARRILEKLADAASKLVSLGATSQHDLNGRMFQQLITDRKFLATYYTLPSSAALLAEIAVERLKTNWSDPEEICDLRLADFACGTGALLGAAYGSALSRYRRGGGNDENIHPRMMESVLVGTDIMPAATHLTASILSSAHPGVPFKDTSIITLPYGRQEAGRHIALGALDLFEEEEARPLFGTGRQRVRGSNEGSAENVDLPHGSFDLVIMNPPFTSDTNPEVRDEDAFNPAFAAFGNTKEDQKEMAKRLKKIFRKGIARNGQAGLASYFLDIAHVKVKPGGVVALVIPSAFVSGESWFEAHDLLRNHYSNIFIITIADSGTYSRAFSADTKISEAVIVATKKAEETNKGGSYTYINLYSRPRSITEAVFIAKSINKISAGRKSGSIDLGSKRRVGHWIRASSGGHAAVRKLEVSVAADGICQGLLQLPRLRGTFKLPVTELECLGTRGPLSRDISGVEKSSGHFRGPFETKDLDPGETPTYPALWAHSAKKEKCMVVAADKRCVPRPGCEDRAGELWGKSASRLHFTSFFTLTSQPLSACLTEELTIGGTAWPSFSCIDKRWEVPIVLWSNTTLGLISFWWLGTRQHQGRSIVALSQLPYLTMIDADDGLSETQINQAHEIFADFKNQELLPANEAYRDDVRRALDEAVLIDLLKLPKTIIEPLGLLRRQWCEEPSVHGGKKTRPS